MSEQRVPFDTKVTRPEDPTKQSYIFDGWYTDNETFLNEWDFNAPITENLTLYAKWKASPNCMCIWILIFIILAVLVVLYKKIKKWIRYLKCKCKCKCKK